MRVVRLASAAFGLPLGGVAILAMALAAAPRPAPHSMAYCPADVGIAMPPGAGAPVRAFVPCREADRIRRTTWRV